jgi:DeoR/GlpR family transcriptional regulator of sugar metabolism
MALTAFDRRQRLLGLMRQDPALRVPEIAQLLGVSQGTVRNDLNALADAKQIIRVRGGGVALAGSSLPRSPAFAARASTSQAAKQLIGRQAARLVEDGDSLLLDASSTVYHMAQHLRDRRGLRIVTNGIEVASLLAQNPSNTVNLVGGILRPGIESVVGPWSERFLMDIRIKIAFVSCSGFAIEGGMSEVDVYEAQFRLKAIEAAGRVVALIDSSKFGKLDLTPSVRMDQISLLLTDNGLSASWAAQLEQAGVAFIVCGEERAPNGSVRWRDGADRREQPDERWTIDRGETNERLPY